MTSEEESVKSQIKLFQLYSKSLFYTASLSIQKSVDLQYPQLSSKFQQDQ